MHINAHSNENHSGGGGNGGFLAARGPYAEGSEVREGLMCVLGGRKLLWCVCVCVGGGGVECGGSTFKNRPSRHNYKSPKQFL